LEQEIALFCCLILERWRNY